MKAQSTLILLLFAAASLVTAGEKPAPSFTGNAKVDFFGDRIMTPLCVHGSDATKILFYLLYAMWNCCYYFSNSSLETCFH